MNVTHQPRDLFRRSISLAVVFAVVLAACGGDDDDSDAAPSSSVGAAPSVTEPGDDSPPGSPAESPPESTTPAPEGAPVVGGTLIVAAPADTGCIDPAQNSVTSVLSATRTFIDTLTFFNPDTNELEPWLAESWEYSDDVTEFTFTLRDDVTFSDGTPLTAEVVKANFDAIVAMGAASPNAGPVLAKASGFTAVDEHTLTVSFDAPNAEFLAATSHPAMGIVSGASAALPPEERCQGTDLIGSGQFLLDSYTPNISMAVSRREGYAWAPPSFANQGDAYLDGIEFRLISDSSVRTGSLISGEIDFNGNALSQDFAALDAAGATIEPTRPNPGVVTSFIINRARLLDESSPLSDPAVRQAMTMSLDRELLLTAFVGARYEPAATSVLSPSTPGYVDLSDLLAYDTDGANAVLDEAGWVPGDDGIREKDGQRLTAELMYITPAYDYIVPLAELAQQEWKSVGIEVTLQPLAPAERQERVGAENYDMDLTARTRSDAGDALGYLRGASPALDEMLDAQIGTLDPTERGEYLAEAQRIVIEDGLLIPLYGLVTPTAFTSKLHGFGVDVTNIWLFHNVWLEE